MKSTGFHEIRMKSGRFQVKSSGFQMKSTQNLINSDVSAKTLQFGGCMEGAMTPDFMKSKVIAPLLHSSNWIVFVETSEFIRFWVDFTWNPLDFMKSAGFHLKSTGFHLKSTRFHGEICQISWWNLPDFVKSAGFHELWAFVMIKYRSFDFRKTNKRFVAGFVSIFRRHRP